MNKIILILIIIVIIAIIILAIDTYFNKEPGKVFSFTGIIAEIKDNSIVLQDKNTVLIDEKTEFIKIQEPDMLPHEVKTGSGPSIFTKHKVLFSDVKVGDRITAVSSSNIRGKTSFEAIRIEILN